MTFTKGYVPRNKGKHHSQEVRQKMRENNPRYWLGKSFSAEHRNNLSISHKGLLSPLKGKKVQPFSKEHRKNLSIAVKLWWRQQKKKRHDKIQNSKRS